MSHTRQSWNTAAPEQLAQRARSTRPTLPAPDGAETWYRISNTVDEAGEPVASVSIYGDIGSWGITAAAFVEELKAVDAAEVNLYLNSPGGEVFDGLAIHNALRSHRARVMVQVDALAASIASVIAMAGDRIVMSPHSQMMIHDASGVTQGNPEELREYAEFLDRQSDNIAAVYAERAGGTVKQWRARMRDETWYFADEAVEAGLADEVAKPTRMVPGEEEEARALAASWDLSVYNYAHTSRELAPAPDVTPTPAPAPAAPTPVPVAAAPSPVFDPDAFRAATLASLDPMPGYQPDQLRDLMAGVAGDAPTAPAAERPAAAYEPQPAAGQAPAPAPQDVAVGYFRSLFTAAANDAPTAPAATNTPTAPEPRTVYVPTPPPPASQVVGDYLRAVITDVANHAPAPPAPPEPEPAAPEPVPAIDQTTVRRALWEAEL
jgi:ATP-dependent protease ClpP protease subunit